MEEHDSAFDVTMRLLWSQSRVRLPGNRFQAVPSQRMLLGQFDTGFKLVLQPQDRPNHPVAEAKKAFLSFSATR